MPKAKEYLLIQNEGEAPVEGYTVLGYSSTRNCGVNGTIGQFGSGSKHAVNLCLRNGLAVWVYCGSTRLEFGLEKETVNDGLRDDTVYHVVYRKGQGNWKRAGWILDFGVLDWDTIGMGLREFVSNSIDRTVREGKDLGRARMVGDLSIKIVNDNERRAKAGFTRIYVEVNDEVREYFGNLGKHFLHFSNTPEDAKPGLLRKTNRNISGEGAMIYREGVFVRELDGTSMFDYNFNKDQIKIDECRNSSDWAVRAACAKMMRDANASDLCKVFKSEIDEKETFESNFDDDYLTDYGCLSEDQAARWEQAWDMAAGPDAVVCVDGFGGEYVRKKGYEATVVKSNWGKAIARASAGIKKATDILTVDEQAGRTRVETTKYAQAAVDEVWELCELANLTGGKEKPRVFCFVEIMKAGGSKHGYCDSEGVHIHVDYANDGINSELKKTALEEVAHWITNATDNSRDFQSFFIDLIVSLV